MPFYYLSFCDPQKPKGEQFLGATVVEAARLQDVIPRTWQLGVNPGGEAAIVHLAFKRMPKKGSHYLNRFVPREQVLAEEPKPVRSPEPGDDDVRIATVCPDCNHE